MYCKSSIIAIALGALTTGRLDAGIMIFTDQGSWESAVGGTFGVEDFNRFIEDTGFTNSPLALNGMEVSADIGFLDEFSNRVEVSPYLFNADIDGTPHLFGDVNDAGPPDSEIRFEFTSPVTAWGAEFYAAEGLLLEVFDSGGALLGQLQAVNGVDETGPIVEFVGFRLTDGEQASRLVITKGFATGATNDSFSIDNIRFVATVPEPTSLVLLATGVFGFMVYGWRRKRKLAA